MYKLSNKSLKALEGVHPDMVKVVKRAIEISEVDFKVLEGVRSKNRQAVLYAQGRTIPGNIVTWTMNSRHFINEKTGYGHAVDLLPAPYDWKDLKNFDKMAKAMFQAADELNVKIKWGADWNRDGTPRQKGETDSPHFELFGY